MSEPWKDVASEKRRQRYSTYPSDWLLPSGFLDGLPESYDVIQAMKTSMLWSLREQEYFEMDASKLVEGIAHRNEGYTTVEVTRAHCRRACVADQLLDW